MNLTRTIRASVTRYNTETLALRDNILAHAGTISASSLLAVDAFVNACKNSGVWPKIIDCGLFIGDQLAAALTKVVSASGSAYLTNHNFVGGDYTEQGASGGLTPDGATKYLDTGVLANAAGLAATAFYNRGVVDNSAFRAMIGAGVNAADYLGLGHTTTPQDQFGYAALLISAGENNKTGLYIGSAATGSDFRLYLNGSQLASSSTPTANPNFALDTFVFAINGNTVPSAYWSGIGSFYAICQALTPVDAGNLSAAVIQLQAALNRV